MNEVNSLVNSGIATAVRGLGDQAFDEAEARPGY